MSLGMECSVARGQVMSLGHERILNPPSSDILVRLIYGDIYDKERWTDSKGQFYTQYNASLYRDEKERGLTREGLSLYLSTTHMW